MKTIIIDKNDANQRIDKYLKKLLVRAPSSFIYKMIRKKDIKINGKKVKEHYLLKEHDVLEMFLYEDKFKELTKEKEIHELDITFEVLYEDDQILVVNKPVGLLVHEDNNESVNTLANQVLCYLHQKGEFSFDVEHTFTPAPVHRLDRNTSGIVIFGKTMMALQILNEMIRNRHCIEKHYLTIVKGKLDQTIDLHGYMVKLEDEARVTLVKKDTPGALSMHTKVTPIAYNNQYSYLDVTLVTGRMHQIRIQLSGNEHPLIGDSKYGDFVLNKSLKKQLGLSHQLLHAYKIIFVSPSGKLKYLKGLEVESPLPSEFEKIKRKLI